MNFVGKSYLAFRTLSRNGTKFTYQYSYNFDNYVLLKPILLRSQNAQTLFSASSLGMDNFLNRRQHYLNRFKKSKPTMIKRVQQILDHPKKYKLDVEELSHLIMICNNDEEEILIVQSGIEHYLSTLTTDADRANSFKLGPVFLRLLHHLNLPDTALQVKKDASFSFLFDQIKSYIILMDLLYEAEKYDDVLAIMKEIVAMQKYSEHIPEQPCYITIAACYKKNTQESLDEALKYVSDKELKLHFKHFALLGALALKRGQFETAKEIISRPYPIRNYILYNFLAMTLVHMNDINNAMITLKNVVKVGKNYANQPVFIETVETFEEAANKSTDKLIYEESIRFIEDLRKNNKINNLSTEAILCKDINFKVSDDFRKPGKYPVLEAESRRNQLNNLFTRKN